MPIRLFLQTISINYNYLIKDIIIYLGGRKGDAEHAPDDKVSQGGRLGGTTDMLLGRGLSHESCARRCSYCTVYVDRFAGAVCPAPNR